MVDPEDGLPVAEDVGEWALEKHERLRKYVDISRAVRRMYTVKPKRGEYLGGATYIDLFCGPGRARLRRSGPIIDGSPLVAYKSAVLGGYPFSEIHVADIDGSSCDAAVKRITAIGGHAFGYPGIAEETASAIISKLNPDGLHFAFLDPYDLEGLSFEVISQLAKLKSIDLLLHVSMQDLQRNLARYEAENPSRLDAFAPGWRQAVDTKQSIQPFRASLLLYWQTLMQKLGFMHPRGVEKVTGSKNQRLYWLVFLSKRKIANDFWDKIRNISGQGDLLV
jgi:three-Cys-motif partner protein